MRFVRNVMNKIIDSSRKRKELSIIVHRNLINIYSVKRSYFHVWIVQT